MKLFKIRHKGTGLFSSGGSSPRWTTKGKAWTSMGHVKLHLKSACKPRWIHGMKQAPAPVYDQAEIVEFQMSEIAVQDVTTMVQEIKVAALKRDLKEKESMRRRIEEEEREQLRKLQQKYSTAV